MAGAGDARSGAVVADFNHDNILVSELAKERQTWN
tara:strand:- start:788 stop:892 length:105 start_codon:yes stop_codon:yes gene_type:complete